MSICTTNVRGNPCGRQAIKGGLCMQHWTMLQRDKKFNYEEKIAKKEEIKPIVESVKPEKKKTKGNEEEYIETRECCICFDPVCKADDALFDCSFFKTGSGSCSIHTECAKSLRDDRCPTCRRGIDLTRLVSKKVLEQRKHEDYLENTDMSPPDVEEAGVFYDGIGIRISHVEGDDSVDAATLFAVLISMVED